MGGHLLQSWDWGAFKHREGWIPERIAVENRDGTAMAQVLFRHRGPVSIGYIPRGPVLEGDRAALWSQLRVGIDRVARRHRALSVIVEADCAIVADPVRSDRRIAAGPGHIQPARTVKVPLLDDDALLAQMHPKTRYNVRLAPRRGVRFGIMEPTPDNLRQFHALLTDTAQRNRFTVHDIDYYAGVLDALGEEVAMLGAWTSEGHLAATLVVARFGHEAVYLYGASSTEHRSNGAAVALQFEAMTWARARGAREYDLWGIPANDPVPAAHGGGSVNDGSSGSDWRGLFRFKTGFGGRIVTYPEPVERRYVPFLPAIARRLGYGAG